MLKVNKLLRVSKNLLKHVQIRTMSTKVRHFPNRMQDFSPNVGVPQVSSAVLKQRVLQNIVRTIQAKYKPRSENGHDGLYVGSAGVSYMFYHLSQLETFSDCREELLNQAELYLAPALSVAQHAGNNKHSPSFLLGNAGIYALATVIYYVKGNGEKVKYYKQLYDQAGLICKKQNFLSCGSDELFVGRAGYILGALWLSQVTNIPLDLERLYVLCQTTIKSGREYASLNRSQSPLMYAYYNVEYLGAAHGLCSILQIIMSVPGYLEHNPTDARDIKASVDFLLGLQDDEGNFPSATDEIGSYNELVHWCHGAAGIIYLMAKAYLQWNDEKYLKSCKLMSDLVWERGLLRKGPGICHGVAGNGYVFLLMYRLTKEMKYLHRATQFAEFLEDKEFQKSARVPDCPYSLFEGLAGTACYLADLTAPAQTKFPFFVTYDL